MARKRIIRWTLFVLLTIVMIVLSGFFGKLIGPHLRGWEELGYIGVFLGALLGNATIVFPVPFLAFIGPLAMGLVDQTGYLPVVLTYAAGATLGESTSYILGRAGRKILGNNAKNTDKNNNSFSLIRRVWEVQYGLKDDIERVGLTGKIEQWLRKCGGLIIFALAFQPIFPFDIAGIVAGGAKYPYWKFLLFCFLGRIPKYWILLVSGFEVWKIL